MSNFNYAARLTETMILGNVALKAGKKVEWNAEDMKIKNMGPEGVKLIKRDYRKGFGIS